MKYQPPPSPVFKGDDPCTKVCAYADAVGAPPGYTCSGGPYYLCENFMPQIKNITAIVVVEMQDGSTQTMNVTLDDAKCTPEVVSNVEKDSETNTSINFWEEATIQQPSLPNITITIRGTAYGDPYMTIQKQDPT